MRRADGSRSETRPIIRHDLFQLESVFQPAFCQRLVAVVSDRRCPQHIDLEQPLGQFGNTDIYNFYSSGEEVLRENADPPSGVLGGVATEIVKLQIGRACRLAFMFGSGRKRAKALRARGLVHWQHTWRLEIQLLLARSSGIPLSPTSMNDMPNSTLQSQPMFSLNSSSEQFSA